MKNKILIPCLILISSLVLSACGTKKADTAPTPTSAPKVVEMPMEDRPYISLSPREDGHMLFLKLTQVPTNISNIEYELIYTATDGSVEIEKGLGDTIKDISPTIERKLLLGTESCTNGCKYKFDEGVSGGTLSLKFGNKNGQVSTYESPFSLKSTSAINKDKLIKLSLDEIQVPVTTKLTGSDFYILIKQYRTGYSVFSNTKNSFTGDYPRQ